VGPRVVGGLVMHRLGPSTGHGWVSILLNASSQRNHGMTMRGCRYLLFSLQSRLAQRINMLVLKSLIFLWVCLCESLYRKAGI